MWDKSSMHFNFVKAESIIVASYVRIQKTTLIKIFESLIL